MLSGFGPTAEKGPLAGISGFGQPGPANVGTVAKVDKSLGVTPDKGPGFFGNLGAWEPFGGIA